MYLNIVVPHSLLILCCQLAYSLKLFVTLKSILCSHLLTRIEQQKILSYQMYMFQAVPSCLSSHNVNKYSLPGLLYALFPAFLCFVLVMLLFKMAPKNKVLKYKKSVIFLTEKTCIRVDQLHSGASYSAVGQEFDVNESTMYIVNGVSSNRNKGVFKF